MQISEVNYLGDLRTESIHIASGEKIISDAPKDNHGKGEAFSPTDFMVNSLAQCMITVMGIEAKKMDINMTGTTALVSKTMAVEPRRVGKISLSLIMPKEIEMHSGILEKIAHNCPVAKSIHPSIELDIQFSYK